MSDLTNQTFNIFMFLNAFINVNLAGVRMSELFKIIKRDTKCTLKRIAAFYSSLSGHRINKMH